MTMHRFKILCNHDDPNSFCHGSFSKFLSKHFDLVRFGDGIKHNKKDTLIAVAAFNFKSGNPEANDWYRSYLDQGFKILVDGLWEHKEFSKIFRSTYKFDNLPHWPETDGNFFICHIKNWFWYLESVWYTDMGYHTYRPNKTYTKLALMPMRVNRRHRSETLVRMSSMLDDMIWSYASHEKYLPNDFSPDHPQFQRHFDPSWYDSTYYSLVTETYAEEDAHISSDIFVTEKTFKPVAFYHPFMCVAQQGHLAYLKSQGFETFENMFDESYDQIPTVGERIKHIVSQSKSFKRKYYRKRKPYSQLTWDKLAHNHDRFYNQQIVESCLIKELVEPILQYAES